MTTEKLDLKGLSCPLPVLRANKAMKKLMSGDILELEVTDPAAPHDFENFSKTTGNPLIACEEQGGHFVIRLRKK